jgi:dihydropteroate synthase
MKLSFREYTYDLSEKTLIMGILNVTPDSFSDGGLYLDTQKAVERALRMEEEGADILDIGGESTRPGSEPVPLEEELRRVIPVIEALSGRLSIPISIDTYKAEVAKRAIEAGASVVNDISGLRFDPKMAEVVAEYDVGVVIMHIKGTPKDMQRDPHYDDLFGEITEYLKESIKLAKEQGVQEERIVVDPGIGFGKRPEHNLQIIKHLDRFTTLGRPVLVGPSRKSFIGLILGGVPPSERLEGTASAVAISVLNGASIVRVHDVKAMVPVVRVAEAIKRETIN